MGVYILYNGDVGVAVSDQLKEMGGQHPHCGSVFRAVFVELRHSRPRLNEVIPRIRSSTSFGQQIAVRQSTSQRRQMSKI